MLTTLRANAWKYTAIALGLGLGFALVMQTLRLFALDIAGARSGPVKTARFNVNGTWVVIGGQGIEDTQAGPPRVLFRDEDQALYSIRSTVP